MPSSQSSGSSDGRRSSDSDGELLERQWVCGWLPVLQLWRW